MTKKIIIDANFKNEKRVVVLNSNKQIDNLEISNNKHQQLKGNIYLAKITRIEPALQAAFVEYDNDKSGFLPLNEINPIYFNKKNNKLALSNINKLHLANKLNNIKNQDKDNDVIKNKKSTDLSIEELDQMVSNNKPVDFDINKEEFDIESISQSEIDNKNKNILIQNILKKNQLLLVQVTKEARGTKGASLTTYISLAGKYCILMPTIENNNGVSKKISNNQERKRLKNTINQLTNLNQKYNTNASIIIRTAGAFIDQKDIYRDYNYLAGLWNKIVELAIATKKAPCFIHQEDEIFRKIVRDLLDDNIKEIVISGQDAINDIKNIVNEIVPSKAKLIKEYKLKIPIYTKYDIENKLLELYQPICPLPSGGYIVINPTEALISIDVNSGKSITENTIEETALKTNIEAVKEIAKQASLRDLSGLIVIDFIDMHNNHNKKIVERAIRECFALDKARINLGSISNFCLFEMSRQRLRPSFLESHSEICTNCNGKGVVRNKNYSAMLILRIIENEIYGAGKANIVNIETGMDIIVSLINNFKNEILSLEEKYNITINFNANNNIKTDSFSIEKINRKNTSNDNITASKPLLINISDFYDINKNKAKDDETDSSEAKNKEENKKHTQKKTSNKSEKQQKKPKKQLNQAT